MKMRMRNLHSNFRRLLSQQGQLAAVIPLSIALAVGGLALWGYSRIQRGAASSVRGKMDADQIAHSIMRRFTLILRNSTSVPAACRTLAMNGVANELEDIRKLSETVPEEVKIFQYNHAPQTFTPSPTVDGSWLDCVLTTEEAASVEHPATGFLRSIDVTVSRLGVPDREALTTNIMITVRAITRQDASVPGLSAPIRSVNLRETVALQAATLGRYAFVLRPRATQTAPIPPISSTNPRIQIAAGSALQVASDVYLAEGGAISLNEIVDMSKNATFQGQVDVQQRSLNFGATDLALDTLNRMFLGGIRFGVFYGVTLPIEDGAPPGISTAWNHKIHYFDRSPEPNQPTVDLTGQLVVGYPGTKASPVKSMAHYVPLKEWVAPDLSLQSDDPGNSCGAGDNNVYVQQVFDENNMTLTYVAGHDHFCGLIATNEIRIDTAGGTRFFYGQIIAKRIQVMGGGKLIVANPLDNIKIAEDTSGLDQAALVRHTQQLVGSVAHNFFVPIFRNPSGLTEQNNHSPYRPLGPVMKDSLWTGGVGVPSPTGNPRVGYIYHCQDILVAGTNYFCDTLSTLPFDSTQVGDHFRSNSEAMDKEVVFE